MTPLQQEVMQDAENAAKETLQEAKHVATATFREVKESAMDTMSAKVDEFKGNVRNAERDALGFLRANAVPLALIGIGTTWFMSNRRSKAASSQRQYAAGASSDRRHARDDGSHAPETPRDGIWRASNGTRDRADRAKGAARTGAEGAEHKVSDVASQVRGFAQREVQQVRGLARDAGHELSEAAHDARRVAGRELEHAREFSRRTTDAHPLAVGAAAMATGLCVGLLIGFPSFA